MGLTAISCGTGFCLKKSAREAGEHLSLTFLVKLKAGVKGKMWNATLRTVLQLAVNIC